MTARILVVDDIEANRRLLKAMLEAKYFVVYEAANGLEAIETAKRERPDIILLDIMMPDMDGFEVCEILRKQEETEQIPVIMVTALGEQEYRTRGLEAGAEDFISKPVDDFALMSRIQVLLRYNAVAGELRQREASGVRAGALEAEDRDALSRPAQVLIIDGNERTAKQSARIIRNAGHVAHTFSETNSMSDASSGRIDIVLLSLHEQSFDPLRVCAHFKMTESTRAISVIAVCDQDLKADAVKALDLGASDVIMSPIDPNELCARIQTQCRRRRYIEILRQRVDRGMELSVIDQLTGLYNRRYMENQLDQWMSRAVMGGESVSVMVIDIDHFKQVNDTWGHDAGDRVLKEFSSRLKQLIRPLDIVCRQGGEEFVIIMPETPGDLACTVADRIRGSIASEEFEVQGVPVTLTITISAGVATLKGSNDTPEKFLKRADKALYKAKTDRRNRVACIAV